jgi:hypothetical protein
MANSLLLLRTIRKSLVPAITQLLLAFSVLSLVGLTRAPAATGNSVESEVQAAKSRIRDFHAHNERMAREDAEREAGVEATKRNQAKHREEEERAAANYIVKRGHHPTSEEIEKHDKADEERIAKEEEARDQVREAFVVKQNRLRQELENIIQIDPAEEYDIKPFLPSTVAPAKEKGSLPAAGTKPKGAGSATFPAFGTGTKPGGLTF